MALVLFLFTIYPAAVMCNSATCLLQRFSDAMGLIRHGDDREYREPFTGLCISISTVDRKRFDKLIKLAISVLWMFLEVVGEKRE